MKVILRKDFEQLGKIGDVVTVKDGYARNFLIPRQIAYEATKGALRAIELEKEIYRRRLEKEKNEANKLALELEKISITIAVKVGDDEKLFGSVTSQMIADALKEKGYSIDKRKIDLEEPIKTLGIYEVNVKLHPEVFSKVNTQTKK
jgi:large subunit ribosomal protein L9